MKSKELQEIVAKKLRARQQPAQIAEDLKGGICERTVARWKQRVLETGSISLHNSPGRPRTARTRAAIAAVKKQAAKKSAEQIARRLQVSSRTVRRVLHDDLELKAYKLLEVPDLKDEQKAARVVFAHWVHNNFRKADTMKILFSDEKIFSVDGIFNHQNQRIWAPDRQTASKLGAVKRVRKFPAKVMVWLGVCSKGLTPVVDLSNGTLNHAGYISKVLPVALRAGNKLLGTRWTFQQDGASAHTHHLSQQWCEDNMPAFINAACWPANSPDLNPMDYCIWNEVAQGIRWDRVSSKPTLLAEIKRSARSVRPQVILESCNTWTKRLYHIEKNKGECLS